MEHTRIRLQRLLRRDRRSAIRRDGVATTGSWPLAAQPQPVLLPQLLHV